MLTSACLAEKLHVVHKRSIACLQEQVQGRPLCICTSCATAVCSPQMATLC